MGSCIHCHMIGDAYRTWYRESAKPMPDEWLFPYPSPETIGLTLDPAHGTTVRAVKAGSVAEKAGIQSGQSFSTLAGQPIISAADVSWVLHRTAGAARLEGALKSGTSELANVSIDLPTGWRETTDSSQRAGAWPMRGMATGGMVLVAPDPAVMSARGLKDGQLALLIKSVGQFGKHAAAKKAGFQKDDVIVEIDGLSQAMTESQLHAHLLRKHFPGEAVKVKILRGSEPKELSLPMQ